MSNFKVKNVLGMGPFPFEGDEDADIITWKTNYNYSTRSFIL
jgi:hypothetical protein